MYNFNTLDNPWLTCLGLLVSSFHSPGGTSSSRLSLAPSTLCSPLHTCSFWCMWLFSRSPLQWDKMFLEGICFPDVSLWLHYLCPNFVSGIWQMNKWKQISEIIILELPLYNCVLNSSVPGKWLWQEAKNKIKFPFMRYCKQCSLVSLRTGS